MSKTTITVPQKDGEIIVRRGGAEPATYKVTDHSVSVDEADAEWFATNVDGAKQASGSTAAPKKEN